MFYVYWIVFDSETLYLVRGIKRKPLWYPVLIVMPMPGGWTHHIQSNIELLWWEECGSNKLAFERLMISTSCGMAGSPSFAEHEMR